MEINIEKRTQILNLLNTQFLIPEEYKETAKQGIKKYANANYSDNILQTFVDEPQSLSQNIRYLNNSDSKIKLNDLSRFRGVLSEWLVCMEYNGMKNKGSVEFTFVNPDPTSKADLLHIININSYYKVIAGPDVKSGQARYLLDQWEKNLKSKYEIPMVDIDGVLTTEKNLKKLKPKQQERYERLKEEFPNKIPISTEWENGGIHQVMIDYFFFNSLGELPSEESRSLSKVDLTSERIKRDLAEKNSNLEIKTWGYFSERSQEIFNDKKKKLNGTTTTSNVTNKNLDSLSPKVKVSKRHNINIKLLPKVKNAGRFLWDKTKQFGNWVRTTEEGREFLEKIIETSIEIYQSNQECERIIRDIENDNSYSSRVKDRQYYYDDYEGEKREAFQKKFVPFIEDKSSQRKSNSNKGKQNILCGDTNEKEFHRNKHLRKLPKGWHASPEKIATARENGFELQDGETWVEES